MPVNQAPAVDGSRMVFVGGLHRSGTTPMSRVLAAHPRVSGLLDTGVTEDEGQHLQAVYPPGTTYGGPGRFAFSPAAHLTENSPLAVPQSAARLLSSWSPYWDDSKGLLLEKSPPNLIMGRFLQAVFPGSSLLVVMRHPVVVALSTLKWRRLLSVHFWRQASVHTMVRHWFAAHQILREDAPHLLRLHVVKYEDLLTDPTGQLAGVQKFLGLHEPFDGDQLRTGHSDQYENRWATMADSYLGGSQRRRIERDFGPLAREFGYDISDLHALTPWSLTR